jgi:hypothetical protein
MEVFCDRGRLIRRNRIKRRIGSGKLNLLPIEYHREGTQVIDVASQIGIEMQFVHGHLFARCRVKIMLWSILVVADLSALPKSDARLLSKTDPFGL